MLLSSSLFASEQYIRARNIFGLVFIYRAINVLITYRPRPVCLMYKVAILRSAFNVKFFFASVIDLLHLKHFKSEATLLASNLSRARFNLSKPCVDVNLIKGF